jgi:SAM-dependent methyltransferase
MNILNYFKALADRTRLRLINILIHYEFNVNEIVSIFSMSQPRISRHLKVLLDSGLVSSRRDGLWIFYSAAETGTGSMFLKTIKNLLENEEEFIQDIDRCRDIIENRSKETTLFFDNVAGDWSSLKQNIIGNLDINSIIDGYIKKCRLAVDIGCGNGDLIPVLLKHSEKVIGVDRSQKMLEHAKQHLSSDIERLSLRLGDLEHLPLSNNEADFAVANMVLHHLSSPLEAIQEVYRILKKRGSFILVDFLKHKNEQLREKYGDRWLGFEESEIKTWLIDSNFAIEEKNQYNLSNGLKMMLYLAVK